MQGQLCITNWKLNSVPVEDKMTKNLNDDKGRQTIS